jgi:hypothetical protein
MKSALPYKETNVYTKGNDVKYLVLKEINVRSRGLSSVDRDIACKMQGPDSHYFTLKNEILATKLLEQQKKKTNVYF